MPYAPHRIRLFNVSALTAIAIVLILIAVFWQPQQWQPWSAVLVLAIFIFASEMATPLFPASQRVRLSISAVAISVLVLVCGPIPAALIGAGAVAAEALLRWRTARPQAVLCNTAVYLIFPFAGAAVKGLLTDGDWSALDEATMIGVSALAYTVMNVCNFVLVVAFWTLLTQRPWHEFLSDFRQYLPTSLLSLVIVVTATLIYTRAGDIALSLTLLGLLGAQYFLARLTAVEFQLRRQRDEAQAYLNTTNAIFIILDAEGCVTMINRAGQALTADQQTSAPWREVFSEGDHALVQHALKRLDEQGTPQDFEARLRSRGERDKEPLVYWQVVTLPDEGQRRYLLSGQDISARREAEEQLEYLAYHDALTGLVNRASFAQRLDEAIAADDPPQHTLAVLFCDLDGFKDVNDTVGHAAGDEVLRQVARRLESLGRRGDLVARQSGDEFLLLLDGLPASEHSARQMAASVAERATEALGKPMEIFGEQVRVGVSIGVALYPHDCSSAEELLRGADKRMYAVKGQRKQGE